VASVHVLAAFRHGRTHGRPPSPAVANRGARSPHRSAEGAAGRLRIHPPYSPTSSASRAWIALAHRVLHVSGPLRRLPPPPQEDRPIAGRRTPPAAAREHRRRRPGRAAPQGCRSDSPRFRTRTSGLRETPPTRGCMPASGDALVYGVPPQSATVGMVPTPWCLTGFQPGDRFPAPIPNAPGIRHIAACRKRWSAT
jgi:hypothetical protein